jgi:hypothetical protein
MNSFENKLIEDKDKSYSFKISRKCNGTFINIHFVVLFFSNMISDQESI